MLPHRLLSPLVAPAQALVGRVRAEGDARLTAWATRSHHAARRNAMVATTAAMARRRDREDVEAYFAAPDAAPDADAARAADGRDAAAR